MSRSLRKGPYIQESLEKKILAMNEGTKKKEVIKTWSRASMISPDFVGVCADPYIQRTFGQPLIIKKNHNGIS